MVKTYHGKAEAHNLETAVKPRDRPCQIIPVALLLVTQEVAKKRIKTYHGKAETHNLETAAKSRDRLCQLISVASLLATQGVA